MQDTIIAYGIFAVWSQFSLCSGKKISVCCLPDAGQRHQQMGGIFRHPFRRNTAEKNCLFGISVIYWVVCFRTLSDYTYWGHESGILLRPVIRAARRGGTGPDLGPHGDRCVHHLPRARPRGPDCRRHNGHRRRGVHRYDDKRRQCMGSAPVRVHRRHAGRSGYRYPAYLYGHPGDPVRYFDAAGAVLHQPAHYGQKKPTWRSTRTTTTCWSRCAMSSS